MGGERVRERKEGERERQKEGEREKEKGEREEGTNQAGKNGVPQYPKGMNVYS